MEKQVCVIEYASVKAPLTEVCASIEMRLKQGYNLTATFPHEEPTKRVGTALVFTKNAKEG